MTQNLNCIKGCGDLLSKAYNVLTFDTQSRVNEIFGGALSTEFLTAVVLIVVVCIGIAFILNSNSIKGSKIIQNIMFGLLVVFILPTFINSVNGIIASSDMGNISTSSVNKIFSANIVDLKYCFGGDTVIDPTGEVHNGFPDDYDYSLLPMDELIKGSETPGIDEVFTKTLLNRGSVDEELGECSSGEIFGNFISFLSSYYYRYKVDMFPIFLSEIATILVMVFTFFKVVRLCYELIVNHFFAYIFAITDIASGAKLREALKSILSTYVVLIYCSVAISLFNTFQAWIFDSSIFNNFEASICIIPVAMAVIDGPNLIERLFGIDAGIKSGFHTAMGLMHAGKTALGMGKAAWNLGKDVTGAKTPLDKARAVRQSELGNYGATHARGNDLETGGRGVADKKEKNGNANEMPHRRGEASQHKKMVECRNKIGTSFYREYLKRIYPKIVEMLNDMENYVFDESSSIWEPDIFNLSSKVIISIYEDCKIQIPPYVTEVSYADYFGHNSLTQSVKEKIIFEWAHNRKAFKVLRKQNRLEYVAGEKAYEAVNICQALPEELIPKQSGAKVVLKLDSAEKFFGIHFKNRLF